MNSYGWAMLLISVSSVLALVSYCLYRVMTLPSTDLEDIEGTLTIDTGDTQNAD